MLRRSAATFLLVIGFAILTFSADAAKTKPNPGAGDAMRMVRLPGHLLPALPRATVIAPSKGRAAAARASQPLTLTIVLKREDQPGFDSYLHDVYNSQSPKYHHFLSQIDLTRKFGPSQETYRQTLDYLLAQGFRLIEGSANHLTLTVRAPRGRVEDVFKVRLQDYRIGSRRFFANDRDPGMPARIARNIRAIGGLSNLAQPENSSEAIKEASIQVVCVLVELACVEKDFDRKRQLYNECVADLKNDPGSAGPNGIYALTCSPTPTPTHIPNPLFTSVPPLGFSHQAEAAPAIAPASWLNADGSGQKIGLVEFDTFDMSDVANYLALMGLPASSITHLSEVHVNGGATPGANQSEVLLDVDAALSLAPGASTVVYDAPFTGPGVSFQTVFNKMIDDGMTVISNSWAYCENQTDPADVQSIDDILASAAASGISVFNGSGDSGSTCLDGSPNTVAVPADSPHATAVGASSATGGPLNIYQSETWWNGAGATPPTGQGGFGLSKFFSRPAYQAALNPSTARSVPDVVVNGDPAKGVVICQASAGGCPTGLLYGGTSNAAPIWAAFTALLNQAQGFNLGELNPLLYPLSKTSAFHSAASMGSDFAHVGLGSPNLSVMHRLLSGQGVGIPSASVSQVGLATQVPGDGSVPAGVPADGTSIGYIVVALRDANGNFVSGKTVTVSPSPGSHAKITPASGVSNVANGAVTFQVTDLIPESLAITAKDTTDGVALTQSPHLDFVTPPAASAGLDVFPASVTADGKDHAVIVVTLKDKLGRPSPGKLVQISQGPGHSVIKGPIPSITNASGQVQFTAVDQMAETVTYSAVDATDGNLPFPGTGTVSFTAGPANGCGNAAPPAAPGFQVTPYATGFIAESYSYGGINFTCAGAYGLAFDKAGNLYVSYAPTGDIYKFPPGGGVADAGTLLTTTAIGPTLAGLVFDKAGNFFASRDATTGNFLTGAVLQVSPADGTVTRTVASNLTCPTALAVDPLSGDLFTDDSCFGAGSDNPDLLRISGQDTATPKTTVYAKFPGAPNVNISFASSGTIYAWAQAGPFAHVAQVSGTNKPAPPTVSIVPNLTVAALGLLANGVQANGDAQILFLNPFDSVLNQTLGIGTADLTTNPPSLGITLATGGGVSNLVRGPDGCVYAAQGDGVFKITDSKGTCTYAAPSQPPALVLAPPAVSPDPAQGTSQTFTASFHFTSAPLGTPVIFQVTGANSQSSMVRTNANGQASFSYTGISPGVDTVSAAAQLGATNLSSNQAVITWTAGMHTSFLTLNLSPISVMAGKPVTLNASLSDISVTPAAPIAGASVQIRLEGISCFGTTNAKGNAACTLTPTIPELTSQTASFAGNATLIPATATQQFNVTGPPTFIPTLTPGKTPTPKPTPTGTIAPPPTRTPTPSRTVTRTPRPTPTPTPRECIATTPVPTVPVPTPTPLPGPSGDHRCDQPRAGGRELHHQRTRLHQKAAGQLLRRHRQGAGQ